jgi:hypothetical protein
MFAEASLEKPTMTPYKPSFRSKMEVSFRPIQQPNGNKTLVAFVDDGEDIGLSIDSEHTVADTEFSKLYKQGEIYATPTPDANDEDEDEKNIFSLGNDPVNVFYIGSVTVVGLYILFRILSKTK